MRDPEDGNLRAWLDRISAAEAAGAVAPVRVARYGAVEDQLADVWLPSGGRGPVVVSLHGGFFRAEYGRDLNEPLSQALCRRGFEVWNTEYRRTGRGGGFRETVADVWASLDAVAEALGDPGDEVAVVGHSAGGYLACFAAAHPVVGLVVSMAGIGDPRAAVRRGLGGGAVLRWMGGRPEEHPASYAAADLGLRAPTGTRHVLVHGTLDPTVPVEQSRALAGVLWRAGDDVELVELPGEGHFAFLDPRQAAAEVVIERLLGWAPDRIAHRTEPDKGFDR